MPTTCAVIRNDRPGGAIVNLLGKGNKPRAVRMGEATLELFLAIKPEDATENCWLFPSNLRGSGHTTRQAIGSRCSHCGKVALGPGARVHHHRMRHSHASHAIQAGTDVFVLQATLGHALLATTQAYVRANPNDSSSLKLDWLD